MSDGVKKKPSKSVAFSARMAALLKSRAEQQPLPDGYMRCPFDSNHHIPIAALVTHVETVHGGDDLAVVDGAMYSNGTARRRHTFLSSELYSCYVAPEGEDDSEVTSRRSSRRSSSAASVRSSSASSISSASDDTYDPVRDAKRHGSRSGGGFGGGRLNPQTASRRRHRGETEDYGFYNDHRGPWQHRHESSSHYYPQPPHVAPAQYPQPAPSGYMGGNNGTGAGVYNNNAAAVWGNSVYPVPPPHDERPVLPSCAMGMASILSPPMSSINAEPVLPDMAVVPSPVVPMPVGRSQELEAAARSRCLVIAIKKTTNAPSKSTTCGFGDAQAAVKQIWGMLYPLMLEACGGQDGLRDIIVCGHRAVLDFSGPMIQDRVRRMLLTETGFTDRFDIVS